MLFLSVLVGSDPARAQTHNWKRVQIHGGGIVSGLALHPAEPGLMYCRTDVGGSYRWNPANDNGTLLLDFLGHPNDEWNLTGTDLSNSRGQSSVAETGTGARPATFPSPARERKRNHPLKFGEVPESAISSFCLSP